MVRLPFACPQCKQTFVGAVAQVCSEVICPHCQHKIPVLSPGESNWLVALGGQKLGPFNRQQLLQLAASGQLRHADSLQAQGATSWVEAHTIPGLFPTQADEDAPKLVSDLPAGAPTEEPVADTRTFTPTPPGPLSIKGIKVRANFSLTLGGFQILRKLGAGGMGAVYLATQRDVKRSVALKVLADAHASQESFVDRFHREIATLASLDHPNIVHFLGAGLEKGIPFFVMEFIEGFNTGLLVKQCGKQSVPDALHIIRRSAEGLRHAFSRKIIHRDIKPENIMITREGAIKITDLGLAKSLEQGQLDVTEAGTTLGSPKYMPPEQARDAKHADQRADIYALGGVLYYLLTAEEPFKGATAMELMIAKEKKQFLPARRLNPDVTARLDLIIDKMLAKTAKYRYQNYDDLLGDIDQLGLIPERLTFDPAQIMPACPTQPSEDLVEILLIDNDLDDASLAKQALEEHHIQSNLVVVADGAEARAYLRREGKHWLAPEPGLIIFGNNLNPNDSLRTLEEIKLNPTLSKIPIVLLASSSTTAKYFESHGYQVRVLEDLPDDPNQFDRFFRSIRGLCLTVMELSTKTQVSE